MGNLLTLFVAFFVSLMVGGVVQNVLAQWARATEELIVAIVIFVLLTQLTTIILGLAWRFGASVTRAALWTGAVVVSLCALTIVGFGIAQGSVRTIGPDSLIMTYIAIPSVVMIAVQWFFIQRRALPA